MIDEYEAYLCDISFLFQKKLIQKCTFWQTLSEQNKQEEAYMRAGGTFCWEPLWTAEVGIA